MHVCAHANHGNVNVQSQDGWTTHAVRINEDNVAYFVLPHFYTHVEHISAGTFGMVVRVSYDSCAHYHHHHHNQRVKCVAHPERCLDGQLAR